MLTLLWHYIKILSGALAAYGIYEVARRLFLHPLSGFPGPKLAASTDLYMAYYNLVQSGSLVDHLEVLHNRYGPVVRIGPQQIHFSDPRAFDDIYTNGTKFTKEPYFYDAFNEQESSFGLLDAKKAKQRKDIMRPLFSRRAILKLEHVIQTTVDKLLGALLSPEYLDGKPANVYLGYLSTSMEVITTYCFARSYDALSAPNFRHPMLIALESTGSIFLLMNHFPFMGPVIRGLPSWLARMLNPESLAYVTLLRNLSSQIDELVENPSMLESAEHEIIYHHLLAPPPGKDGVMPSKKSLLDEAGVLIAAGSDTVGNTCTIGTFYILSNKAIYQKLVRELQECWPDIDTTVGYEKLEKLPYLTAVIKESLRMSHGVVSPLPRVVHSPSLIAGVSIPANTVVSMGASFMHNNPENFEDPFVFRPERWLNDKARDIEGFLVPFSKGPRSCLGINLAWCELYLIFANIFRKIDMEIHDTTVDDLKFRAYLLPEYRGKPLHVTIKGQRST